MLDMIGLILSILLVLSGFLGSILPILPGPPLSFIGLLLYALLQNFSPPLTLSLMIVLLIVTIGVTIIDYLLPLIGAKRYGTSKWGILGAIGGMIIGTFFSPFGLILGAFIGAVLVEWFVSRNDRQALKAGWGIIVGTLLGMGLKLGTSGIMAYYLIRAMI